MQSKPKPNEGESPSNFFPDFNPLMRGAREAAALGEPRAEEPAPTPSGFFPKPSNFFETEALEGALSPPGIGMTTREELKKPNIVLRLLGVSQGIDSVVKNPLYQKMDTYSRELAKGNFWERQQAIAIQESQMEMLQGGILFSVFDWEERPRHIITNLMAVEGKRGKKEAEIAISMPGSTHEERTRRGRYENPPASWDDYKKAISDGIDGKTEMGFVKSFKYLTNPYFEVSMDRLFDRYPKLKKINSVLDGVEEFAVAVILEAGIAKAGKMATKPLSSIYRKFIPTPKPDDTIYDVFQDMADAVAKDAGATSPADALIKSMQSDPDLMDETLASYKAFYNLDIPGAASAEEVVKGMVYRKWINTNIRTKANPAGFMNSRDVGSIIEAMTQGQRKLYTDLNYSQLEALTLEMQAIKDMPKKFRDGALINIRRKTYGPPVNTFTEVGMGRRWDNTMSSIYLKQEAYNSRTAWMIDIKRDFKKRFKRNWLEDDAVDHAMSYAAEGYKYDDIPRDDDLGAIIQEMVTREEYTALQEYVITDQDNYWNMVADIAEEQGKISSDPLKIAAGVAPRVPNYYPHRGKKIQEALMQRLKDAEEAGSKITVPVDYDLDKIIKKGRIPQGVSAGEWIARKSTADDFSRNWTRGTQVAWREELHDVYVREQMILNKAVVETLPDNAAKKTVKDALSYWHVQILNQPAGIDMTLNKSFSFLTKKMEAIFPKWEARERAFNHFAQFMSRRIDQGLLLMNPRPTVRNLFQGLLTTNIFGNANTLWGYQQLLTPGGRKLLQTSQVYLQRGVPLASFDITKKSGWQQLTYLGIHATDKYFNVGSAYLAGWRYYLSPKNNPRAWKELVDFAKKRGIQESALRRGSTFSDTVADAVNAGMFQDARRTIDFRGIGFTQWHYDPASMPPMLRPTAGKLGFKYSTWTDYMWGAHAPQTFRQLRSGLDIFGNPASAAVRYAILGTMVKGALLHTLGTEIGVDMTHLAVHHISSAPTGRMYNMPTPFPVSPVGGLLAGLGGMALGAASLNKRLWGAGVEQVVDSGKAFIPFYGIGRQAYRTYKGEQGIGAIFLPVPRKDKWPSDPEKLPGMKGLGGIPGL